MAALVAAGGGARLAVSDYGAGPAVLLLHGWPVTAYHWRHLVPALVQAGMRAITVEPRGLGGSSSGPGGYDKETLAVEVTSVLLGMGIPRFAIVGHDWGGTMGYLMAADLPDQVRALIIEDEMLPGVDGSVEEPGRSLYPTWHGPFNRAHGLAEALVPGREDAYFGTFLAQSAGPNALVDEAIETYLAAYRDPARLAATLGYYRTASMDVEAVSRRARVTLDVPVMTIGGELAMGRAVERCFARVAIKVDHLQVEGAGHYPVEQRPDVVNQPLIAFLAKVASGA